MTPIQRVLTTLSHREPDRVPLFLLLSLHGARALGLPLREYLTTPRAVVEGQARLQRRFQHDCLYGLTYAAAECEAFGGEVLFFDDGPPNAGAPPLRSLHDIDGLAPPDVASSPPLRRGLEVIAGLRDAARGEVPVIGVVISPFSLPVMQLGFERYLELLFHDRPRLARLLAVNEAFCAAWGNAQLAAGATALAYFDPVSSMTCVPRSMFLQLGLPVARRMVAALAGPIVAHMASAQSLGTAADWLPLGVAGVTAGAGESLAALKDVCRGRATVLGGLNGVELRRYTPADAERAVRQAIDEAAPGGGFVLTDLHGEVPFQVTDEVLEAVVAAVETYGRYPAPRRESAA